MGVPLTLSRLRLPVIIKLCSLSLTHTPLLKPLADLRPRPGRNLRLPLH
jgi:hypothetical protein